MAGKWVETWPVQASKPPTADKLKEEQRGNIQSTLNNIPGVIRERVLPGETKQQARKRWAREREIESDRTAEGRRVGGRVMPVKGAE